MWSSRTSSPRCGAAISPARRSTCSATSRWARTIRCGTCPGLPSPRTSRRNRRLPPSHGSSSRACGGWNAARRRRMRWIDSVVIDESTKEMHMSQRDVVVLGAARSAIGTFGGALADMEPAELAGTVMKEAVKRSGVDPKQINYVTVGNTIPTEGRFPYVARVAAIQAGLPMDSVAMSVNRLCSSGLQGIVTTAQNILLGDCDYGVGGGVEVMSRGGYLSTAMRTGARMGDTKLVDMMVATLTDPFGVGHMGVTAENLVAKWGITREDQDALAVESQRRAAAAIAEGRFKSQIVPIVKQTKKGEVVFDTDEHVKANTTMESLAKLKPAFKKDGGSVTAGNASGVNDGAAFFVLGDAALAAAGGHKPLARIVSYAVAGVPNEIMGVGPIPASEP